MIERESGREKRVKEVREWKRLKGEIDGTLKWREGGEREEKRRRERREKERYMGRARLTR